MSAKQAIPESSLEWMPKLIWGPLKWRELHVRAMMDFPMKEQSIWFNTFVLSIPCPKCQAHFQNFVLLNPPDFSTLDSFFYWTVQAHNHVNQELGKPIINAVDVLLEIAQSLAKN